jgi:4-carboxymuconolactone decarboxylase
VGFQLPIASDKEQNVKEEIIMANKADLEKGLELRKKLLGKRASAVTALGELAPDLEEIMNEVLFGRVWTRPGLEPKMRSAITIASLMAMQRLPQLKGHIANGLNLGLSKQEIIEILIHIAFYAGVPTAVNAFQLAKEVFAEEKI